MSFLILPVGDSLRPQLAIPPVQPIRPVTATVESAETGEPARRETMGGDGSRENRSSERELGADLERLQESFAAQGITLSFTRDDETEQMVVKMIDQRTGEAVRQMPSEVSLKLAAEIGKLQGLIIDRKA